MTLIEDARKSTTAHLNVQQTSLMQSIRMVNAMGTQNTFIKVVNGVVKIASAETDTGQARNILEGTASGEDARCVVVCAFPETSRGGMQGRTRRSNHGQQETDPDRSGHFHCGHHADDDGRQ